MLSPRSKRRFGRYIRAMESFPRVIAYTGTAFLRTEERREVLASSPSAPVAPAGASGEWEGGASRTNDSASSWSESGDRQSSSSAAYGVRRPLSESASATSISSGGVDLSNREDKYKARVRCFSKKRLGAGPESVGVGTGIGGEEPSDDGVRAHTIRKGTRTAFGGCAPGNATTTTSA